MPKSNDIPKAQSLHGEIWNFNLQKLEDIQKDIRDALKNLKEKYSGFDSVYRMIEEMSGLLSSLCADLNPVRGGAYAEKLLALVRNYRKRYTSEGIDFRALDFLTRRIFTLVNASFSDFPRLERDILNTRPGDAARRQAGPDAHLPYQWISFRRYTSWFLTSFKGMEIAESASFETIEQSGDTLRIRSKANGTELSVTDPFARHVRIWEEPRMYILLNGRIKNFAASEIGKRVFSSRDFITPKTAPLKHAGRGVYSGRVKIFGKNHLVAC